MEHCPVCRCEQWELFATAFDRVLQKPQEIWKIHRCPGCGMGWTSPFPDQERLPDYYPPHYLGNTIRTLDDFFSGKLQRSRSWRRETEKVALVERFVGQGNLLDVGSGDGKFLWALDSGRWNRVGVEMSQTAVGLVSERMADLVLIEGDIFSEHLLEGSFDVITFWHVFEHLSKPQPVLERVHRLLRAGGWVFVSLPNLDSLQARLFRRHWYAFDDVPRHLYHFSPRSLEILLQSSGLRVHSHLFFSRMVNIHCLKYSFINWSEAYFGNRLPYYFVKPFLFLFPALEQFSGKYGMLTTVAQKLK